MMLPGGVAVKSVQFEMESWTGARRAFAVKSFYKNNDSYVAAQREFRKKFGTHRNSKVPSAHAIKTRLNNFEETGSTVKKKGGSVKTILFLSFRRVLNVIYSFWGNSPASEF